MKTARIWILLLLSVLLPVRGAIAAAMLCAPSSSGLATPVDTAQAHAAAHLGHAHGADTGGTAAAHAQGSAAHLQGHASGDHHHDEQGASGQDRCGTCAASCSLPALLSAIAPVPLLSKAASHPFPEIGAAEPSFFSDAHERPPRTR